MHVRATLIAGIALIALAFAWTLSRTPQIVARSNSEFTHKTIAVTTTATGACQARETMPRGTSSIRLGLTAVVGPRIAVSVHSGSRLIAEGARSAGWGGGSVTVPVHPAARSTTPITLCFSLAELNGPVEMLGLHTHRSPAVGQEGKRLPGRLHIEYLRAGHASWWSMAFATARRLGLGRAESGTWNAVLVAALAAIVIALSSWLVARDLR